ncbi:MAG: hypothetical protein NVS1B6_11970 [Steroidobacteraceae bacterium]
MEIVAPHCAFETGTEFSDSAPTGLDKVHAEVPDTEHIPMPPNKNPQPGSELEVGQLFAA